MRVGAGWRAYVTVDGKRKYTAVLPTKALASQAKRELLNQRDTGELAVGKVMTLKAWLDAFLLIRQNDAKPLRATTAAGYRYYIDHYIDPNLGSLKLDKLTMERLEAFYAKLAAEGIGGATIHQCHAIIRVALKHAVWRGKVSRNVAALVQPPSVPKSNAETLSEADVAALFAAAQGDRYEARWHLSLGVGVRPGEVNAIEWPDINFETRRVRIHQQLQQIRHGGLQLVELPKTVKGDRSILLPRYIVELLRDRREAQLAEMIQEGTRWRAWEWKGRPRAFVFTQADGSPIPPRLDTTNWTNLLVSAGLPHTRRYTTRHTAASMMITNGIDPATVSKTLGHATVAFTMATYVHAVDERQAELADQLDAAAAPHLADTVQDRVQASRETAD